MAHFNFWVFTALDDEVLEALEEARAVIWPQVLPEPLYRYVQKRGLLTFPNYEARFNFPGKDGQLLLFRLLGLPHPRSVLVPKIASLGSHPGARRINFDFPLVLKVRDEHEGHGIYLLRNEEEWRRALEVLRAREISGRFGFVLQEFFPSEFDLRVVVIGRRKLAFWRRKTGDFRGNIARGGKLVTCPSPDLEGKALRLADELLAHTGINLAAIDFLVGRNEVLLNEINYVFGRRALKGRFEELFFEAVRDFLKEAL